MTRTTSSSCLLFFVIPVFSFDRPLLESPAVEDPFFGSMGAETLKSLVARLEKARDDHEVKGVIVLLGPLESSRADFAAAGTTTN